MIEATTKEWPYGVATLRSKIARGTLFVAAALMYETPDGFAIVSPGYMDPNAGGNNFHRIAATVRKDGDAIEFDGPEWSGRIEQYEPTQEQIRQVGDALEWYEGALAEAGIALDGERERVRRMLAADLG